MLKRKKKYIAKISFYAVTLFYLTMGFSIIYFILIKIEEHTPILNPVFLINVDSAQGRLESMRKIR